MDTRDLKILANDFMSEPLAKGISDCEMIGEALFDAAEEIERLQRIVAKLSAPVGWKFVPVRATESMLDAAEKAESDFQKSETGAWFGLRSYYRAMVEAAPEMTHNV